LTVASAQTTPSVPVGPQTAAAEPAGFAAVSRAVVSAAAELVIGVQRAVAGPGNVRTAKDNAWQAILADRARREAREELAREVAAMVAARARRELPARHPAATTRSLAGVR
jgi:hypothetical protein